MQQRHVGRLAVRATYPRAVVISRSALLRLAPVALLVAAAIAVFALRLDRYVSFEQLDNHRAELLARVEALGWAAPFGFIAVYAACVSLSVPVVGVFTVAAGFLFGIMPGAVYSLIGATAGAAVIHMVARTAVGHWLAARAGPLVGRLRAEFNRGAASYLLVLRLLPIFPFFLVNLVPALMGVPLGLFVVTTFFGSIPIFLVLASIGHGLGAFMDQGRAPDMAMLFSAPILMPLAGLAVLSLVPVAYRWISERRVR